MAKTASERGRAARRKGQTAERTVVHLLQPYVETIYRQLGRDVPQLRRNLMQTAIGGFDLIGLEWMALEVKHCNTLALEKWWRQTLEQTGPDQEPVLFYKKTGMSGWRVRMTGYLSTDSHARSALVDIDWRDFVEYMYLRICEEFGEEPTGLPSIHDK